MRKPFNNYHQQKLINERHAIINGVYIEPKNNIREVLDDALRYPNDASEDGLEYREGDIKHLLVNHIRHEKTNYESGLKSIHKVGVKLDRRYRNCASYYLYKNATLEKISQAYPFLERECDQQKRQMNMLRVKKALPS